MTDPNEPAYAIPDHQCHPGCPGDHGLTKREEFAKAAMQGMLANSNWRTSDISKYAVEFADLLIDALNEKL